MAKKKARMKITPAAQQIADWGKRKAKQLKAKAKFKQDQIKAFDQQRKK